MKMMNIVDSYGRANHSYFGISSVSPCLCCAERIPRCSQPLRWVFVLRRYIGLKKSWDRREQGAEKTHGRDPWISRCLMGMPWTSWMGGFKFKRVIEFAPNFQGIATTAVVYSQESFFLNSKAFFFQFSSSAYKKTKKTHLGSHS